MSANGQPVASFAFVLDVRTCRLLLLLRRTGRGDDSTVRLEYASEGKAVATGRPYGNRYISVVTIKNRKIIHWRDYLDPLRVSAALED